MAMFLNQAPSDAKRAVAARGLRAIGDGFVSIVLPAYLLALGYNAFEIGALMTATLLGSAVLTFLAGMITSRFGERRPLLWASALMVFTGTGFAVFQTFGPLLVIAFMGTLNPSAGDVSVFLPLEQALLARSVEQRDRTLVYAYYSAAGALLAAVGTLFAAIVDLGPKWFGISAVETMRLLFIFYAVLGAAAAFIYRGVSDDKIRSGRTTAPLGPSRAMVYRLTALFSVDAFGGGFFVQTILAIWLLQSFHLPIAAASTIFFWTNLFTAISYFAAVPIAKRFGLINTMVFTHLPSNLCLVAIPFISNLTTVIVLLVIRSLLSQMDVPTRTSYVMAVVTPPERPAAASLTSVPRSLAAAISPALAGYLLNLSTFGWPLLIGGTLKIGYDLTLLFMFRHIRAPEELSDPRVQPPPAISSR
jgi:MFS family permease